MRTNIPPEELKRQFMSLYVNPKAPRDCSLGVPGAALNVFRSRVVLFTVGVKKPIIVL